MMWRRLTKLGQRIIDASCDWHRDSRRSQYGVGDCCSGVPLDAIYAAIPDKNVHQIDGAIAALRHGYLMLHEDEPDEIKRRTLRLDPPAWLSWTSWRPEYLPEVLDGECGQDWGDLGQYDEFQPEHHLHET
jgi:hypothetical protein